MTDGPACDYPGCGEVGVIISRLSPEGYLVATGKKAYSFREAYRRFHYCNNHHDELMNGVRNRRAAGGMLPSIDAWKPMLISMLLECQSKISQLQKRIEELEEE